MMAFGLTRDLGGDDRVLVTYDGDQARGRAPGRLRAQKPDRTGRGEGYDLREGLDYARSPDWRARTMTRAAGETCSFPRGYRPDGLLTFAPRIRTDQRQQNLCCRYTKAMEWCPQCDDTRTPRTLFKNALHAIATVNAYPPGPQSQRWAGSMAEKRHA